MKTNCKNRFRIPNNPYIPQPGRLGCISGELFDFYSFDRNRCACSHSANSPELTKAPRDLSFRIFPVQLGEVILARKSPFQDARYIKRKCWQKAHKSTRFLHYLRGATPLLHSHNYEVYRKTKKNLSKWHLVTWKYACILDLRCFLIYDMPAGKKTLLAYTGVRGYFLYLPAQLQERFG